MIDTRCKVINNISILSHKQKKQTKKTNKKKLTRNMEETNQKHGRNKQETWKKHGRNKPRLPIYSSSAHRDIG